MSVDIWAGRRLTPALEVVEFTARCPACGTVTAWTQTRHDTRTASHVGCGCA